MLVEIRTIEIVPSTFGSLLNFFYFIKKLEFWKLRIMDRKFPQGLNSHPLPINFGAIASCCFWHFWTIKASQQGGWVEGGYCRCVKTTPRIYRKMLGAFFFPLGCLNGRPIELPPCLPRHRKPHSIFWKKTTKKQAHKLQKSSHAMRPPLHIHTLSQKARPRHSHHASPATALKIHIY